MTDKVAGPPGGDGHPGERRVEERTTTVFRPVLIETEGFAGFCLVRNLSPNGMMGTVYTQFAAGLPIRVQFTDDILLQGIVKWSRDGQVGIRFDGTVDVSAILGELGKKMIGNKVNRAPRLSIQCPGELVVDGRIHPVELQNISQRGLNVKTPCYTAPDEVVLVRLEGLEQRKAVVRWTRFGTVGMAFLRPLGFAELAEWAVRRQTDQSNGSSTYWQNEA